MTHRTVARDSAIVAQGFSGSARVAVDGPGLRFAVTDGHRITVITLGPR